MGGLGFLRPAPGTWGSMPHPAIAAILLLVGVGDAVTASVLSVIMLAASLACVVWGRYAEERFGLKDAAEVVADETAGVAPATILAMLMTEGLLSGLAALAGAFLLFRVFDILKPWPARQLEALPAGWGVLIDDLVAGVYAAIVLGIAVVLVV